jgi:hypothetical protein
MASRHPSEVSALVVSLGHALGDKAQCNKLQQPPVPQSQHLRLMSIPDEIEFIRICIFVPPPCTHSYFTNTHFIHGTQPEQPLQPRLLLPLPPRRRASLASGDPAPLDPLHITK